ncbi:MAG: Rpn family recombination-promoting nuclease/putative transposase [Rhodocyclaceae bacterium]
MPHAHDTGYKLLFSDKLMVRDLVQGFIDDPWLHRLDFDTLERVNGQYVTEDMRQREDDVVWRVKSGEDWLYLYLLIEFQSTDERFMTLRMMVYVGLLYQDLVRQKQLGPQGLLPPVLPIVLYNGEPRWRAPTELSALLPRLPGFLAALQPQMRYLLIDEGAYPEEALRALPHNLAAGIFRLEQPLSPEQVQHAIDALEHTTRPEQYRTVRRLIAIWLRAVLKRNRKYPILLPELDDLQELRIMLSQRIEQWAEGFIAKGEQKGRLEGRLEGQARILARQLTRRFGLLPDWAAQRLNHATEQELEAWSEAVLDADSLNAIFGHPPGGH